MTSLTNFKDFWRVTFWLVKIAIVSLALLWHLTSLAIYTEATAKTNVNKVDPLFNEKIENYKEFEQVLEEQKGATVKGVESEAGFSALVGSDEAGAKASNLSSIRAEELEGAGFRESAKEPWINEYLVDYSKPGMMRHKEDAMKITEATGKMLDGLIGMLRKLDIDCKQVKGNKELEPQYYIQVSKELDRNKGDTVYDRTICEELRNSYSCRDHLAMNCVKQGMQWENSEYRIYTYYFRSMRDNWRVLSVVGGDDSAARWYNLAKTPSVMAEVRANIAANIGVDIERIEPELYIPQFTLGDFFKVLQGNRDFWYLDEKVDVGYRLRHGKPICLQWSEQWSETCTSN